MSSVYGDTIFLTILEGKGPVVARAAPQIVTECKGVFLYTKQFFSLEILLSNITI